MESNTYLLAPNGWYHQELRLVMNEQEIADLYQVLAQFEEMNLPLPKVAKDLKVELWYMLTEIKEFNEYLRQGGEP